MLSPKVRDARSCRKNSDRYAVGDRPADTELAKVIDTLLRQACPAERLVGTRFDSVFDINFLRDIHDC